MLGGCWSLIVKLCRSCCEVIVELCVCVCVGVSVVAPMGGSPVRFRLAEVCPWLSVEEGGGGGRRERGCPILYQRMSDIVSEDVRYCFRVVEWSCRWSAQSARLPCASPCVGFLDADIRRIVKRIICHLN